MPEDHADIRLCGATYDPEAQAVYLQLRPGPSACTIELGDTNGTLVDEDAEGNLLGVEILHPAERCNWPIESIITRYYGRMTSTDWALLRVLASAARAAVDADPAAVPKFEPARRTEYLFLLTDGRLLLVRADAEPFGDWYASFATYLGAEGEEMRHLAKPKGACTGTGVDRHKDGGTTFVATTEGVLYSPSKLGDRSEEPRWNREPITELDPADWLIEERVGHHATARPRQAADA